MTNNTENLAGKTLGFSPCGECNRAATCETAQGCLGPSAVLTAERLALASEVAIVPLVEQDQPFDERLPGPFRIIADTVFVDV